MDQEPLYLVGPTAVGKSRMAVELALRLDGEIISLDAMQVYRSLEIGTAKPSRKEQEKVRHYMIDVVDPLEAYDVAKYVDQATVVLNDIQSRGKSPILVGGTGLYVKAMMDGLFELPLTNIDQQVRIRRREEWLAFARLAGPVPLHQKLDKVDPDAAKRIHPRNVKRVIRSLEVFEETGVRISQLQSQWKDEKNEVFILGLERNRERLYHCIDRRVDQMMEEGLFNEVQRLKDHGIEKNPVVMQAIGYKELLGHLNGVYSMSEAIRLIKRNSRRFAKRQWTWFKKDKRILWFNLDEIDEEEVLDHIIFKYQEYSSRQKMQ